MTSDKWGVAVFEKVNARRGRAAATAKHLATYATAISILLGTIGLGTVAFGQAQVSRKLGLRSFTLDQAIQTALQRNPDILRAKQEIQRTKGLVIQVRAEAIPHLDATSTFRRTDPNLTNSGSSFFSGDGPTPAPTVTPIPTATPGTNGFRLSNNSYDVTFEASQLVFAGGRVFGAIRAASFTRDASYYQLRSTVDQVIATVRQQFYLILLNKDLIGVQEESVQLLQSQLRDQQNRFEAGTVPRFNVLRAEVELSNQQPQLIRARNNYRISQLQLAKTLGLDFDPARGDSPPLNTVGALSYEPRDMPLGVAIELGKERRAFLKQQRVNILNQVEQVRIAFSGFFPTLSVNGGYQYRSSPFSSDFDDVAEGYFLGGTGSWAIFDGFETYGRVKQARATLEQAKITYDDAVRQVELEVQQAFSSLQQGRELIASQVKNVEQADESLRLATARLDAGAGTQLEVLDARVALTLARSTRLQALYDYNAALAEFDRVTATDTVYTEPFDDPLTRKKRRRAAGATSRTTTTTSTSRSETERGDYTK